MPCIAYIITASGHAYWLDSGELVAASVLLDISHPPGHPLSALYGKLVSLLPFGSLSFRVALGQAFATAAAGAAHCCANAAALRGMRLGDSVTWALALLGAWLSALTYGLWFQAIRPEVYALQTLCVAVLYERLLQASAEPRAGSARALLPAAFALGLSLANHHLTGLLLLPAFLPVVLQVVRERRLRPLGAAFGLGALALSTYLYLPLRAWRAPPANLGDPSNWSNFWWVVSARVYARNLSNAPSEPFATRMLDVIGLWYEDLGWLPLALACMGLYLGLRLAATRRAITVCALVLFTNAIVRAKLGPVRANPDILGYLAPSYLALGTLCACALGALAYAWKSQHRPSWLRLQRVAWLLPLGALALIPLSLPRSSLARFTATDELDELRVRRLPARTVVIESAPQTVFRGQELLAVEGARPDVVHVPLPILRYPGVAAQLIRREPELAPLVRSYLSADDRLQAPEVLRALARERPVFVEPDTRVDPGLYGMLAVGGVLSQVVPDGAPTRKQQAGALEAFRAYLRAGLAEQRWEPETIRQLIWLHYLNAVQLGATSQLALARSELDAALQLEPSELRLRSLRAALSQDTPIEPHAFLQF